MSMTDAEIEAWGNEAQARILAVELSNRRLKAENARLRALLADGCELMPMGSPTRAQWFVDAMHFLLANKIAD